MNKEANRQTNEPHGAQQKILMEHSSRNVIKRFVVAITSHEKP